MRDSGLDELPKGLDHLANERDDVPILIGRSARNALGGEVSDLFVCARSRGLKNRGDLDRAGSAKVARSHISVPRFGIGAKDDEVSSVNSK